MRKLLLFIGGVLVGLVIQMAIAQSQNNNIVRVNHVGIAVPDVEEALTYYSETLGFEEAFRINDSDGNVALVYAQVSQNTFVEIQPINELRPAGISHFGVHVDNMEAVISMFRERGAEVQDSIASSSGAILSNVVDPYGVRIELLELPAESVHRQAMDRWQ